LSELLGGSLLVLNYALDYLNACYFAIFYRAGSKAIYIIT